MTHRNRPLRIAPPPLSDQAAVDLLEFLHDLVACFESRYFDQIHRFYQDRSAHNLRQHAPPPRSATTAGRRSVLTTANQQWTGTREWCRSIAIIYVTRLSTIIERENQNQ